MIREVNIKELVKTNMSGSIKVFLKIHDLHSVTSEVNKAFPTVVVISKGSEKNSYY